MEIVITKKSGSIMRHNFAETSNAAKWVVKNCENESFHFQGNESEYKALWEDIEYFGGLNEHTCI